MHYIYDVIFPYKQAQKFVFSLFETYDERYS